MAGEFIASGVAPEVSVEVAFASQPGAAAPTWTPITADVVADTGVTITRGRSTNRDDINPGTLSLTLTNDGGRYALGSGAFGVDAKGRGQVKVGKRIRVRALQPSAVPPALRQWADPATMWADPTGGAIGRTLDGTSGEVVLTCRGAAAFGTGNGTGPVLTSCPAGPWAAGKAPAGAIPVTPGQAFYAELPARAVPFGSEAFSTYHGPAQSSAQVVVAVSWLNASGNPVAGSTTLQPQGNGYLTTTGTGQQLVPAGAAYARLSATINFSAVGQLVRLGPPALWLAAPTGSAPLTAPRGTVPFVRYIRETLNGSSASTQSHWVEVQAYRAGTNVALGSTATMSTTGATAGNPTVVTDGGLTAGSNYSAPGLCTLTVDLGVAQPVESVTTWHYYTDGRTYNGVRLQVSADGVTWTTVFDEALGDAPYAETSAGRTVTLGTDYGSWSPLFDGFVDAWPTSWDNGSLGIVQLTATDGLKNLGRRRLSSMMRETIELTQPLAYWPLQEPPGALSYGCVAGGQPSLVPTNSAISPGGTIYPAQDGKSDNSSDGTVPAYWPVSPYNGPLVLIDDFGKLVRFAPLSPTSGQSLYAPLVGMPTTGFGVCVTHAFASGAPDHELVRLVSPWGSTLLTVDVLSSASNFATYRLRMFDKNGVKVDEQVSVASTQVGTLATLAINCWADHTYASNSTEGGGASSGGASSSAVLAFRPAGIYFGGADKGTGFASAFLAHAFLQPITAGSPIAAGDLHTVSRTAGSGDRADGRIQRLAAFLGLALGTVDSSTTALTSYRYSRAPLAASTYQASGTGGLFTSAGALIAPIAGTAAAEAIKTTAASELGLAFLDTAGRLAFQSRTRRFAAAPRFSVSVITDGVGAGLSVTGDDQGVCNILTMSRPDGGTLVVKDNDSIAEYGEYADSLELLVTSDSQLGDAGAFLLLDRAWPAVTITGVAIDAVTNPQLWPTLLSLEISDLFTITDLPAAAGPTTPSRDLVVEGYQHAFGTSGWTVTLNTSRGENTRFALLSSGRYTCAATIPQGNRVVTLDRTIDAVDDLPAGRYLNAVDAAGTVWTGLSAVSTSGSQLTFTRGLRLAAPYTGGPTITVDQDPAAVGLGVGSVIGFTAVGPYTAGSPGSGFASALIDSYHAAALLLPKLTYTVVSISGNAITLDTAPTQPGSYNYTVGGSSDASRTEICWDAGAWAPSGVPTPRRFTCGLPSAAPGPVVFVEDGGANALTDLTRLDRAAALDGANARVSY